MKELTVASLYTLEETIAKDLFEGVEYPWEVLPKISSFILELGAALPEDEYDKVGEDVWIAKSAKVFESAYIHGPAIIGKDAEVRHCAFIRGNAIVGEGAVVGNSTELKNVVLFNKVQVPHYNYVGDSILGYKAHMGAGSITSNVKSDKKLVVLKTPDGNIETGIKKFGAMLGDEVDIYARTKSKVEDVISEGAAFHESISECVKDCEAVITIVGFPKDVEEVYFDEGNILDSAREGTYLIDMTTTSPMLAQKIYEAGTKKGFHVLDAPVTGGDTGAKAGTLSILAGGRREDYEACRPLFEAMGTNINYQGEAGCGQHAKLANQIMIAGTLSGVCEAITYAKAKGLDLPTVLRSVSTGAAGSKQLDIFGPKILAEDYAPGFFMKHFIKDMKLALTEANMSELSLDVLSQVLANYEELEAEGYGDLGTQALMKYYEESQA